LYHVGTTIISDLWKAYNGIANWPMNYTHRRINHSENFVDPLDPEVHTQNVESLWSRFKKSHVKRTNGMWTEHMGDYVQDYMWRQLFSQDTMFHFWTQVSQLYPCQN
jgi:hypothetical protein